MLNRRTFITQSTKLAAAGFLPTLWKESPEEDQKFTILHTNDVHSRLEPFPMDGGRNQGLGGVAARTTLIHRIRQEEENVLLLDAGDIFQGTPFFNLFKGEPEIKAMSAMQYDAATMGNHDFDGGIENFAQKLSAYASFPLIICNYDFKGTPMEHLYVPYKVFRKGKLKIGVLGVGIELEGLVPDNLTGGTLYLNPIVKANETAAYLHHKEKCDFIICLSHLGNSYKTNKVSDEVLAKSSEYIDVIIGGHTHTFLDAPLKYVNKSGMDVWVNQVGWAGIKLGRLDFSFNRVSGKKLLKARPVVIEQIPRE